MSSQIITTNIDGTYPVAGQDNDSQGFRDNFTNIKNNFTYAKSEIEDLQDNVVRTDQDNNMNGSSLSGGNLVNTSETRYALGTTSGSVTVNLSLGNVQSLTLNGNATLAFSNFPTAGKQGKVRLVVTITSTSYTLTMPAAVINGLGYIKGLQSNVLNFDATGTYTFEFTSDDAGASITMFDLTRGKIQAISRTPTGTGQAGDIAGMMTYSSGFLYVCFGNYDGSTVIWKKATLNTI